MNVHRSSYTKSIVYVGQSAHGFRMLRSLRDFSSTMKLSHRHVTFSKHWCETESTYRCTFVRWGRGFSSRMFFNIRLFCIFHSLYKIALILNASMCAYVLCGVCAHFIVQPNKRNDKIKFHGVFFFSLLSCFVCFLCDVRCRVFCFWPSFIHFATSQLSLAIKCTHTRNTRYSSNGNGKH